jgi:hypothetical protein
MMGSGEDVGIVPMMNRELFHLLGAKKETNKSEFLVTASYMEIYNEVLRDLLNPSDKQLKIREHPKLGIYVESLAEIVVDSSEGISKLLEQGNAVKQVAATAMNNRSSRSHCCFVVNIKQRKVEELGEGAGAVKRESSLSATINLVDLAGSERADKTQAEGARLKEGAAINLSLSTLGTVINLLAEGKRGAHIPYRNSKLTRVLQQALGGNARTVMLAAVSPADYNHAETLSTLQYAARAKTITNRMVRNEDVTQKLVRELRLEVERLRMEVAKIHRQSTARRLRIDPGAASDEVQQPSEEERSRLLEMQRTIEMLEESKKRQWDEVQKLSRAFEEEREKTLKNKDAVRAMMQTVKDEQVGFLKTLGELESQRGPLAKELKVSKQAYEESRAGLERDMATYTALLEGGASEGDAAVREVFKRIELGRDAVLQGRSKVKGVKELIKDNEERAIELRAELEAHRAVIESDKEIRRQVQEEERAKLALEIDDRRAELVSQVVEREVAGIEIKAAEDLRAAEAAFKQRLRAHSESLALAERKALSFELQLLDAQLVSSALRQEVAFLQQRLQHQEQQHEQQRAAWARESKATVGKLLEAFGKDSDKLARALKMAATDCVALAQENHRLQQRVADLESSDEGLL